MSLITSPIEDHKIAHDYAVYLADVKHKDYTQVHCGARWELALAAYLGPEVHRECRAHLKRVRENVLDDFAFDFTAGGLKIDAKSTRSLPGRKNSLLVTKGHLRSDVAYVLGDCRVKMPGRDAPSAPMPFDAAGWEMGDPSLFAESTIPGLDRCLVRERSKLRPVEALRTLVRERADATEVDLRRAAAAWWASRTTRDPDTIERVQALVLARFLDPEVFHA
jgi:hypothetical protein